MTPTSVTVAQLQTWPAPCAVLADPRGLLALPSCVDLGGHPATVLLATDNVTFRQLYEPLRDSQGAVVVVRRRADLVLPDLLHRAGGEVAVTPRVILAWATGEVVWPAWLDAAEELLAEHLGAIAQATRQVRRAGRIWSEALADEVVLRAVAGFDLSSPHLDPAAAWQALAARERLWRKLAKRGTPLAGRLQAWLRRQPPPLGWLDLADPDLAVRLTWIVALLLPHRPDLAAWLPRGYPPAAAFGEHDLTAVARVAYRLQRLAPELAAAQRDTAELAFHGALRGPLVELLRLAEPAAAAAVVRRETRSGHLALLALRTLLGAIALDEVPHELALEPLLDQLLERVERLSQGAAVRAHAELLRALLRLDRLRPRLQAWSQAAPAELPAEALALAAGEGAQLESDLAAAHDALEDNALHETQWNLQADPARHKAVLAAWQAHLGAAEQALVSAERELGAALLAQPPAPAQAAAAAWDELLTARWRDEGDPPRTLVLVAGLSWAAWSGRLAPRLAGVYDSFAEPLWAPLPSAGEWSLPRAVGGLRWQSASATWDVDELLGRLRPELGLRRRALPAAWRPLGAAGLVRGSWTGGELRLLLVDLLAAAPGGLPAEAYHDRLAALAAALVTQASGRQRDRRVTLLACSGAVLCRPRPGLALAGQPVGARAVRPSDEPPPVEALGLAADQLGLPGPAPVLLAYGRGRLVPATDQAAYAAGGLSLAELAVPLAQLTPVPRGERAVVRLDRWLVPERVVAGQPVELAVDVTLVAGALADLARLTAELPDCPVGEAVLDRGERQRLTLVWTPQLPAGARRAEQTVTLTLQVGRRRQVRRVVVTVVAATPQPAAVAVPLEGG
ncbi:MAG: hypothetical protein IT204_22940 [Fimbriimonadaceae bacterium]|nr:hypothetical protein [Fimbriimonadaceae bacterium]